MDDEGECDLRSAALVPEYWLSYLDWIAVLDLTDTEAGPLFLGDICTLQHYTAGTDAPRAAVHAAKHLEHARWSLELWSPSIMVMDLRLKRRYAFGQLLRHIPDACRAADGLTEQWYRGSAPRRLAQLWLTSLASHVPELLGTLPSIWNFVPYEPWLFDVAWSGLMNVPSLNYKWREIFRLREYPGFDGQHVRVACPPLSAHVPTAMFTMTGVLPPGSTVAGRIPDDWGFWSGPQFCGERVAVLALRFERGEQEPVYPFALREAPWIRRLLALYEGEA